MRATHIAVQIVTLHNGNIYLTTLRCQELITSYVFWLKGSLHGIMPNILVLCHCHNLNVNFQDIDVLKLFIPQ